MFYRTEHFPPDYHQLSQLDWLLLIGCQDPTNNMARESQSRK